MASAQTDRVDESILHLHISSPRSSETGDILYAAVEALPGLMLTGSGLVTQSQHSDSPDDPNESDVCRLW